MHTSRFYPLPPKTVPSHTLVESALSTGLQCALIFNSYTTSYFFLQLLIVALSFTYIFMTLSIVHPHSLIEPGKLLSTWFNTSDNHVCLRGMAG